MVFFIDRNCAMSSIIPLESSLRKKLETASMPPKLDKPASLTVPVLREELSKRGLATTGLKSELVARLTEAMEGNGGGEGGGEGGGDADGDAEMVRTRSEGGWPLVSLASCLFLPPPVH